jgi:hypothetical protein
MGKKQTREQCTVSKQQQEKNRYPEEKKKKNNAGTAKSADFQKTNTRMRQYKN